MQKEARTTSIRSRSAEGSGMAVMRQGRAPALGLAAGCWYGWKRGMPNRAALAAALAALRPLLPGVRPVSLPRARWITPSAASAAAAAAAVACAAAADGLPRSACCWRSRFWAACTSEPGWALQWSVLSRPVPHSAHSPAGQSHT